jgi:hypothetical protein
MCGEQQVSSVRHTLLTHTPHKDISLTSQHCRKEGGGGPTSGQAQRPLCQAGTPSSSSSRKALLPP